MENQYAYHCPHCSQECSVAEGLTGQTVDCPHCTQAFYATPPDQNSVVIVPEKLPFFKSSRKRLLKERLQDLVQDGEMSSGDEAVLGKTASLLGLEKSDLDEITKTEFLREFDSIKRDMESTW